MIALAPGRWWSGLGRLTRSGSATEALAWALYDFANTIFSFAVVSVAMGLWAVDRLGEGPGQFWFAVALSVSVLINAAASPVLGAVSDRTGRRKPYLLAFTALTIVPTALIGLVDIRLGLIAFAVANFGYQAALIYYDALLPGVARPESRGRLSGIGVALGYLGTIVSGLLYRYTTDAGGGPTLVSFLLVAVLFSAFAVPIFLLVRETTSGGARFRTGEALRSWSQLRVTIGHARQTPGLLRFVVGRFFYTDPVNTTIAVMSVFAVSAVGFTKGEALLVILGLTVIAVVAAFGWGLLADGIGPKRTLLIVLGCWAAGLLIIGLTLSKLPFLVAGALLGAGLGGVGVTDRLLLLRLAPPHRVGEMLGLYGLAGKFSAVVGPLLYGVTIVLLLDRVGPLAYQAAILSLLGLLLVGLWIIRGVPEGTLSDLPARDALGLEPAIVPPGELSR